MDFYIGGYGQGKLNMALEGIQSKYLVLDENDFTDYFSNNAETKASEAEVMWKDRICIINHLHLIVRRLIMSGMSEEDIYALMERICLEDGIIVISDEIGNGIVPADREDRIYRDIVGECQQRIAAKAENVYRVYCGLCQKLK